MEETDQQDCGNTLQAILPSPYVAPAVPGEKFDPDLHVAFGEIFLENDMSGFEDEIKALTHGAGLPDRGDQGWISFAGSNVLKVAEGQLGEASAGLSPGEGICAVRIDAVSSKPLDLYAEIENLWI